MKKYLSYINEKFENLSIATIADEFGLIHIPDIEKNEYRTPFLDFVFNDAQARAKNNTLVQEAMAHGILAGYPVVDVKVGLTDGSFHNVDSSEMAFKISGGMAFKKGFMEASPVLLEPISNLSIQIPKECVGDVIGDLNSRRGKVLGMDENARSNKPWLKLT